MFLEEYTAWKNDLKNKTKYDFETFYRQIAVDKDIITNLCDISFQILMLQECVEGLLEDLYDYKSC